MDVAELRGTVLITRPEEDAAQIAQELEDQNYQVLCEPFLKISFLDIALPDLKAYAGIIFTSINAVRAVKGKITEFDLPVFCVGHRTHDEAVEAGFRNVQSAEGTVDDLSCLITSQKPNQAYLYIRGQHISKDLGALVTDIKIDEVIAYHAEKIEEISNISRQILMRGEMSAVLFFSVRTAEAFVEWVKGDSQSINIAAALGRSRALCLGDSMVEYLSEIPWKDIQVAEHPNRLSLMRLL
jgi:uroporphyrinogen-III synthase